MNYESFKMLYESASAAAGFPLHHRQESIDVAHMERFYEAYAHRFTSSPPPFHTGLKLTWSWDALLSARADTTEEDFLDQVWLDEESRPATDRPYLRLDSQLFATIGDKQVAMPSETRLERWHSEVDAKLENLLPCDYPLPGADIIVPVAGRLPPYVKLELSEGGPILRSVSVDSFQLITLPRQWDDTEREDPDPQGQLGELFDRLGRAFDIWANHLHLLVDSAA